MKNTLYVITVIGLLIIGLASCGCIDNDHIPTPTPDGGHQEDGYEVFAEGFTRGRAVSLNALQEMANECMAKGTCSKDIHHLYGIKRVSGYVIDEKNKDLILIGEVDDTSPPLYLEDFVIALRNEWLIYAPLKDNTYLYSPPGCSIDPDPDVLNSLQHISSQISRSSNPEEVQKYLSQWHTVCSQSQQVRVMGIPTDSRFAEVMVDADYYMKRLVDGSVTLDIPRFISLTDMTLSIARSDVEAGKPSTIPLSSLNRFWFSPGENSFLEGEGIVYISNSEVILLTEEEHLTKRGEVVGTEKPNPLADEFAKNFSARYAEIAKIKPIYTELEALFRFVSLAKMMKYRNAASEAGLSLDYLLNQYPVKSTQVNRTLPGLSHVKEWQHKEKLPDGYRITTLWLPSCGGVSADINIRESNIASDRTGSLCKTKEAVLKAKPAPESISWDFPSRSSEYEKIYQNIDKYPEMKDRRVLMFNQKDESTIQIAVIGENVRKTEEVKISDALRKFFEKWNKAKDESTRDSYLTEKEYLGELLSFLKKIDAAAEGREIILDGPQVSDYVDIVNLYYGGDVMITTKYAVPEAVAETLKWNKHVNFKTSDIVIVYSANPNYLKTEQDDRIALWKTLIEEINTNIVANVELKIVESPEEVFHALNEIKDEGVVVIRVGETGDDGYTIMPGGTFNNKDIEDEVADNPKRVTFFANCDSIKHGYPDAGSKTGGGINIGTTREVLDKEDVIEFLGVFTKELEANGGNLLDASRYAVKEQHDGRNYEFIKFAQEHLEEKPGDLEGAIEYAREKTKEKPAEGSSGIQLVVDSRRVRE